MDSNRIAKIKWQCRRGMLELDLILMPFIADGLDTLTTAELANLETLLSVPDPMLYAWLMGEDSPDDKAVAALVLRIRNHIPHH